METLSHALQTSTEKLFSSPLRISILCVVTVVTVVRALIYLSSQRKRNEVPFPGVPVIPYKRHFLLGHLTAPRAGMKPTDQQQAWSVDHADPQTRLCSFYLMNMPILSVLKAEHAQKVLRATTYKRHGKGMAALITRLFSRALGKKNIVLMNGKEWKLHRSSVTRALHSEEAMKMSQRYIHDVGHTLIHSILTRAQQGSSSEENSPSVKLEMVHVMKMATMDVFGASALGRDLGCCRALQPSAVASAFETLSEDVIARLRKLLSPASHLYFLPTKQNHRFHEADKVLRGFLKETIEAHMDKIAQTASPASSNDNTSQNNAQNDTQKRMDEWHRTDNLLCQIMAINSDPTTQQEARLNVDELVDFLVVLLFAGYDTTANAVSYALHQVATHPEVERRCVEEARRVLGSCASVSSKTKKENVQEDEKKQEGLDHKEEKSIDLLEDVVEALPYCHAVLLEALRLYPPAGSIDRTLEKSLVLDGITIPAWTTVRVPIYHIQREEGNFPRPLECIPERWVQPKETSHDGGATEWEPRFATKNDQKSKETTVHDIPAGSRDGLVAFAGGARNCAGRRFALQEGTMLLAMLVRELQFEVPEDYEFDTCLDGMIMEAKDGLPLLIRQRG